jgi:hypothetical protein
VMVAGATADRQGERPAFVVEETNARPSTAKGSFKIAESVGRNGDSESVREMENKEPES